MVLRSVTLQSMGKKFFTKFVFYRYGLGLQRSLRYLAPVLSQVRLERAILSEDILVSTSFEFTYNIIN
jgi:hypothetical protein